MRSERSPFHVFAAVGTADNQWNEGVADLTALTGQVDLSSVKALAIGVGGATAGSSGLIYIDDVRLYPGRATRRLKRRAHAPGFVAFQRRGLVPCDLAERLIWRKDCLWFSNRLEERY